MSFEWTRSVRERSVSGLCQGLKYFSFNGISLYKLKESFLKTK